MKKFEVTLWAKHQPPILVGYFDSKSEINDYLETVRIHPLDTHLSIVKNNKNTQYKKWKR